MTLAVFRALLNAILRSTRKRVEDVARGWQGAPLPPSEREMSAALLPVIRAARTRAWAASVLFLRGQARKYGADESWVPPIPGYSEEALRRGIRSLPPARRTDPTQLMGTLTGHVMAASRRTIVDAVHEAPDVAERVDDLLDLDKDLGGFSEEQRERIRDEVRKHERQERRHMTLDEALDEIGDRVDRAIQELDEADLLEKRRQMPALADPPSRYRLDREGRRIARPFAFARVVRPSKNGPCGFCAVLASRGPVYRTSESAGLRVDRFHRSCRCEIVPVFTSRSWPGKSDHERFEQVYNDVVKKPDLHGADALRAMDRYMYRKRKER